MVDKGIRPFFDEKDEYVIEIRQYYTLFRYISDRLDRGWDVEVNENSIFLAGNINELIEEYREDIELVVLANEEKIIHIILFKHHRLLRNQSSKNKYKRIIKSILNSLGYFPINSEDIKPTSLNEVPTKKRTPLTKSIRHEVFKRDDYRCLECGVTNKEGILHVDHIIPVSQGGSDELDNLQTLCEKCNLAKSNRTWKGGSD